MARLLAITMCLATACGGGTSAVPVKGKDVDLLMLSGKWVGEYEGFESRRQGSINFDLAPGYHTAEGEVIMHPTRDATTGVPLQIKFVQIGGGQVSGKMAAYTDPGCSCLVETEFTGTVAASSMSGTFVTRAVGESKMAPQTGRWSAQKTDGK